MKKRPVESRCGITTLGQEQHQCSDILSREWVSEGVDVQGGCCQLLNIKLIGQLPAYVVQALYGILNQARTPFNRS